MKRQILSDRKMISKLSSFQALSGNILVLDQNFTLKSIASVIATSSIRDCLFYIRLQTSACWLHPILWWQGTHSKWRTL